MLDSSVVACCFAIERRSFKERFYTWFMVWTRASMKILGSVLNVAVDRALFTRKEQRRRTK